MKPPVVDGHNHLFAAADLAVLGEAASRVPLEGLTLLATPASPQANDLPRVLWAKSRFPDRIFAFGAWNHGIPGTGVKRPTSMLAEQVREQAAAGVDGWKILESKPDLRRDLGEALDGPYFAQGFAALDALDLPVLWHVADPEEFWDAARVPAWAQSFNWHYGPEYPSQASLYAEVERVLMRHPRLRVVFAHFFFMGADLDRAARFLSAHPRAGIDLAPGVEYLYHLSRDRDRSRDFFIRHADRIYFGTDAGLMSGLSVKAVEARIRLVLRFLTTGETFRVPPDADVLLGPPEAGIIHGLDLPPPVLERILAGNQRTRTGDRPKPLDRSAAAALTRRIAAELRTNGAAEPAVREAEDLSASIREP